MNSPDPSVDALYLKLKGVRESLCLAQTLLRINGDHPIESRQLEVAIIQVDLVGSQICRQQWSRFDQPEPWSPYHTAPQFGIRDGGGRVKMLGDIAARAFRTKKLVTRGQRSEAVVYRRRQKRRERQRFWREENRP